MRTLIVGLSLTLLTAAATAQESANEPAAAMMKTFMSSSDVAALVVKAKSDLNPAKGLVSEPILRSGPYNVNLEYRTSIAPPAMVHERTAELFYVIDGTATLVTGGKLANEKRPTTKQFDGPAEKSENRSGRTIEAGTSRQIAKGDFFIVPPNTPHWFSAINGALILMEFHVPEPAAKN